MHWSALTALGLFVLLMFGASAQAQEQSFDAWVVSFKERAMSQGISPQVVADAFEGIEPNPTVVRLDRKQPEHKITMARYLANTVTPARVAKGRAMLEDYADTLNAIGKQYGVQPKYIVALWAIESDFGRQQGDFLVIRSLATLAYEGRRREFFSKELLAALRILEAERMSADELRGSWAGAMGNCQFMPSTYLNYAVDATGDGKRDIWNARTDTFASIANYLASIGWNDSLEWGHAVLLPRDFSASEANIKESKSASYWRKRGLRYLSTADVNASGEIPDDSTPLYAMLAGDESGDAYLLTKNFHVLLNWNRSRYFATAVGTLADAIGEPL